MYKKTGTWPPGYNKISNCGICDSISICKLPFLGDFGLLSMRCKNPINTYTVFHTHGSNTT